MNKADARKQLRERGLRVTAPRVALMQLLSESHRPMSHTEVVAAFGDCDWDPTTIYRNLVKLCDEGLARVASQAGGKARYEFATADGRHAHFACDDCGTVTCLRDSGIGQIEAAGRWKGAVAVASVELQGQCPDCIEAVAESP